MAEILVSLIGGLALVLTTLAGVFIAARQTKSHVQSTVTNGIQSVIEEIHRDMTLTVLPALVELKAWKEGFDHSPFESGKALDEFVETVGGLEKAILGVQKDMLAVQRALDHHVAWEEQHKYADLEAGLARLYEELSRLESPRVHGEIIDRMDQG